MTVFEFRVNLLLRKMIKVCLTLVQPSIMKQLEKFVKFSFYDFQAIVIELKLLKASSFEVYFFLMDDNLDFSLIKITFKQLVLFLHPKLFSKCWKLCLNALTTFFVTFLEQDPTFLSIQGFKMVNHELN